MATTISTSVSVPLQISNDYSGTLQLTASSGLIYADSSTAGLIIPAGTTAQRPSSPVQGMMRYNTTIPQLEFYNGSTWTTFGT
jgi:hypothetical protein